MPDITIPPVSLEAAKEAWYANHHKGTDERMTITCLAMLKAWPGAYGNGPRKQWKYYTPAIILPLQQESDT